MNDRLQEIIFNINNMTVYSSKKYGDFIIIEYMGKRQSHYSVKIRFVVTGCEAVYDYDKCLRGEVKDSMYGYNPNKIFQSNSCGPFKMIKYIGIVNKHSRVLIKFINTGYEADVQLRNAIDGKVKDPIADKFDKRDFDKSRINDYESYINARLISIYDKMIRRCYDASSKEYKFYGALGVTVDNRWVNNVNNFINDARYIDRFNCFYNAPYNYQLDKDYKQLSLPKNQRIYSKNTCIFLSYIDNLNVATIDAHINDSNHLYGVHINKAGNYYVYFGNHYYGTYTDKIVAANVFNYLYEKMHCYEIVPLFNNVPYVYPSEFIKYNTNPKEMCIIVEK